MKLGRTELHFERTISPQPSSKKVWSKAVSLEFKSPSRLVAVDIVRVFAMAMMVQGHTLDVLLTPAHQFTSWYNYWLFCRQDVVAEYGLSEAVPELSPFELDVWRLDQLINRRGVPVDLDDVEAIIHMTQEHEAKMLKEFVALTGGAVESPTQVKKLQELLNDKYHLNLIDLQKGTLITLLAQQGLDPIARRLLEYQAELGAHECCQVCGASVSCIG